MRRFERLLGGVSLTLSLIGCGAGKPPDAASRGPTQHASSSANASEALALTVYNQSFGLVREVRRVSLGTGQVELAYADVSAHIQPETVHIRSLSAPNGLAVLEQNYRYDLLTPETLLQKYVGKTVRVYRYNEQTGKDEAKPAELLSVQGGPVVKIDGQVTSNFPGRFAFPEVPDNLVREPTLVWLLSSAAKEQRVEVTYLTQGLNWQADYVLTLDPNAQVGSLNGWVTLSNETGTSYKNAELKLVAGDVQRVQPNDMSLRATGESRPDVDAPAPAQFKQEGLFEYHLYTLQRPTDLLDKEQKQVSLLAAAGIRLQKRLILSGSAQYYRAKYGQVQKNQQVGVYLDFQNSEANHLGMPLPKGTLRVYQSDSSGQAEFVGEDSIEHTPRDERVRVKLGEAFDVVGDRSETAWNAVSSCVSESSWQVTLRNHKDSAERVLVYEPAGGDWEILSSSLPATRQDSSTFTFDVPLAPRSETKLTYRVRVHWC